MSYCKMSTILAYAMSIYVISSIYYMIRTRYVGTPFKDSLTKEQLKIKKESAKTRSSIFYQGIGVSFVALLFFQPFSKCN
jgi:hypothetical protein